LLLNAFSGPERLKNAFSGPERLKICCWGFTWIPLGELTMSPQTALHLGKGLQKRNGNREKDKEKGGGEMKRRWGVGTCSNKGSGGIDAPAAKNLQRQD